MATFNVGSAASHMDSNAFSELANVEVLELIGFGMKSSCLWPLPEKPDSKEYSTILPRPLNKKKNNPRRLGKACCNIIISMERQLLRELISQNSPQL